MALRDEFLQNAEETLFDNDGTSFGGETVRDIILEDRRVFVNDIHTETTSLNGTHYMMYLSGNHTTAVCVKGTATGYSIVLPDATILPEGIFYSIYNQSTQNITIKDNDGTALATVNSNSTARAVLIGNTTAAGDWVMTVISSVASGVNAYNVTSDTTFSTTSSTYVLITGMTITPPSGTYGIWFTADIKIVANNKIAQFAIAKNGTVQTNTQRDVQGVSSNFRSQTTTMGIIQVNGSEALDVRCNISSSSLNVEQRSFLMIRLGQ